MSNNRQYFYIDGKFSGPLKPGSTFPVVNPATEETLFDLPLGSEADVDAAVDAAERAFRTYSLTTREERIKLFERIIEIYKRRTPELGQAISSEMGAPLDLASGMQAGIGLMHLVTFKEELATYPFEEHIGKGLLLREPIGVVAMITPWNWPLNQITLKVGAALAVGCTMVLKPSEFTPTSAAIFAEVLHEAGVPPGVFNLVQGVGPVVGAALSGHPKVQMVSFTGSTRAGIDVAIRAAPTVKRVSQELGGKSANILLDDAGFAEAVKRGAAHCFHNCGQSCNAPTRMLVPAARVKEAADVAAAVAADTHNGPVVNKLQWTKIQGLIQKGIDEGVAIACGGTGLPEGKTKGFFIKPTVFYGSNNHSTIAREEIFGPVLTIIPYTTIDEAVDIANDTPYGLAGYVQGLDVKQCLAVARRIRAGNISVNGTRFEPKCPFGGYKQSGNGREMGRFGLDDVVEVKAIVGVEEK